MSMKKAVKKKEIDVFCSIINSKVIINWSISMEQDLEIYNSLLPILIVNVSFVAIFMYYAVTFQFKKKTPEVMDRLHASFLGVFFREFWYWFIDPMVKTLIFLRISPNMITAMSVLMSIFTGYLYFIGQIAWAGWFVIISGNMDLLDGRVARVTGNTTLSGGFFDACVDRYNDAFVFMGVGLYFVGRNFSLSKGVMSVSTWDFIMLIVVFLTIIGSSITSYSKAKGEAMGYTTKRGLMQRPERIVMLGLFSIINPWYRVIAAKYDLHPDAMIIGIMILMAILVNYSAIVRIVVLFKNIKKNDNKTE
jgi:CDP-diacylglycerol--glycerol-3-phosphate 3-phosphatidyltransferase